MSIDSLDILLLLRLENIAFIINLIVGGLIVEYQLQNGIVSIGRQGGVSWFTPGGGQSTNPCSRRERDFIWVVRIMI